MEKEIKILMVDDEEQFRKTTSRILEKKGYETTLAKSGEEAIEILKIEHHDVVILDIKMEGMDGHEALVKIKELRPEVKVIMLTGHGSMDSAIKSQSVGADDYFTKPCDIDVLSQRIKTLFSKKKGEYSKNEKTARELMVSIDNYSQININTSVAEAVSILMKSYDRYLASSRLICAVHRSMLVNNDSGMIEGVLSVKNLIDALRPDYLSASKPTMADSMQYSPLFWSGLFTSQAKALAKKTVGEIMSESLVSVDCNTNLMEIADMMYRYKTRRVIVMDEDKVVGIVREQELLFEIVSIIL